MKRRRFRDEFKAKVAVEAVKGQRTVNELSQEFGVHANQINQWKTQLLDGAAKVFGQGNDREYIKVRAYGEARNSTSRESYIRVN